jgi:hypothetical protein
VHQFEVLKEFQVAGFGVWLSDLLTLVSLPSVDGSMFGTSSSESLHVSLKFLRSVEVAIMCFT